MTPPASAYTTTAAQMRCTYEGTTGGGWVDVNGMVTNKKLGDHVIDFTWPGGEKRVLLEVHGGAERHR